MSNRPLMQLNRNMGLLRCGEEGETGGAVIVRRSFECSADDNNGAIEGWPLVFRPALRQDHAGLESVVNLHEATRAEIYGDAFFPVHVKRHLMPPFEARFRFAEKRAFDFPVPGRAA